MYMCIYAFWLMSLAVYWHLQFFLPESPDSPDSPDSPESPDPPIHNFLKLKELSMLNSHSLLRSSSLSALWCCHPWTAFLPELYSIIVFTSMWVCAQADLLQNDFWCIFAAAAAGVIFEPGFSLSFCLEIQRCLCRVSCCSGIQCWASLKQSTQSPLPSS